MLSVLDFASDAAISTGFVTSIPIHDTLIIGAGVIGSSVAMHLARMGVSDVKVVDPDMEGTFSSSELNAGGVRATWTQPVNIEASRISIEYFSTVSEEVGYRDCGYLWLHPQERIDGAMKARELQLAMGWPVESWDVNELRRRVPFIDKPDGIAGAIYAPRDGLVNPNRLKNHFREKARAHGAIFEDRIVVRGVERDPSGEFRILCERLPTALSAEEKMKALEEAASYEKIVYRARRVVNCAGPWAPGVAALLGYFCPSKPLRRQVCIFDCRDVDLTPYGMIVDTSGVYFHPEATNGLAGFANTDEPSGVRFDYDGDAFFMERIWPALYERSTAFERLKHLTGWAGLYEVSPDETAIIGPVEMPGQGNAGRVFEAHSFSGHGVMHSYAAGLALAEIMVRGSYQTWDAQKLQGSRFEAGRESQWIRESWVI